MHAILFWKSCGESEGALRARQSTALLLKCSVRLRSPQPTEQLPNWRALLFQLRKQVVRTLQHQTTFGRPCDPDFTLSSQFRILFSTFLKINTNTACAHVRKEINFNEKNVRLISVWSSAGRSIWNPFTFDWEKAALLPSTWTCQTPLYATRTDKIDVHMFWYAANELNAITDRPSVFLSVSLSVGLS